MRHPVLAEMFDLEHRVPLTNIASVQECQGAWGHSYVDLEFVLRDDRTRRFSLALRKNREFLNALKLGRDKSPQGMEAR